MTAEDGTRSARRPMRNLSGNVAEQLGVAIVSGTYRSGTPLPSDIDGSQQFSVSRAAYREAIKILAAKGLVDSRQKAGNRVTERSRWNFLDPDILAWMFDKTPSETFVRDLFELRTVIEPAAAEMAAQRRDPAQLSRMGHALEEMARHGIYSAEGRKADEAFHAQILTATGNELFISLINSISAAIHWSVIFNTQRRKEIRDSIPDHRALYGAIADGDPAAAHEAARKLIALAHNDTNLSMRFPPRT